MGRQREGGTGKEIVSNGGRERLSEFKDERKRVKEGVRTMRERGRTEGGGETGSGRGQKKEGFEKVIEGQRRRKGK